MSSHRDSRPTVVFGASGYVGGRLIPVLIEGGHTVRAVSRAPRTLDDHPWRSEVEVVEADVLEPSTLSRALAGAGVVYYLVHSMGEGPDFAERDRRAAENLRRAAAEAGIDLIVYLGGLGDGELSPHLASRQEVGRILAAGEVPLTELRAAVIIGSGSLSFELIRYLTEVLPVMITPSWVRTTCQPIAIRDVLDYLAAVPDTPETHGGVWEIGGADTLSYEEMMQIYAEEAGLRRRVIIPVPVLSLGLSARWVGVFTPLSVEIASELIRSLGNEVVVGERTIGSHIPLVPAGYRTAIRRAVERTRSLQVPTRWVRSDWNPSDPLPTDPSYATGTVLEDVREVESGADQSSLAWAFMRVGGDVGYYSSAWAWHLRGLVDQLFGGAGLRRGRRHPEAIRVGEPLDFWRVAHVEPHLLQLKAEMRLPGEAWLEWEARPAAGGGTVLRQTASFVPRGLWGRLYWYGLLPFHAVIFPRMARGVVEAAERHSRAVGLPAETV